MALRIVVVLENSRTITQETSCYRRSRACARPAQDHHMSIANNLATPVYETSDVVRSTKVLTTNAEAVPEIQTVIGTGRDLASMANPYPDPEMQKVLSRKYPIFNFTWSDSQGAGDLIAALDIMDLLVGIPNIADKLTQFKWLCSDVELEVKLNSTPFHIGSLMLGHLPRAVVDLDPDALYALKTDSLTQLSQLHGMVLTAGSTNNVKYTVFREAPVMLDPINAQQAHMGALGVLVIRVLNPLILATAGSVNPVAGTVFASFKDPHPAGYGYFPLNPVPDPIVPHSKTVEAESKEKSFGSIVSDEATTLFKPLLANGDLSSVVSTLESGISAASQFLPLFGLSKPPNQTTPVPCFSDDYRDVNYIHGVSNMTKLAAFPTAGLGDSPISYVKKNKLSDVIQTPAYIFSSFMDKDTPLDSPFIKIPIHPSMCGVGNIAPNQYQYYPTHLAYVSNNFRFWRGGMKVRLHFVTSQFVSVRVRLSHWPGSVIPSSIEAYAGDVVSEILDIRGETVKEILIPYIAPVPYLPCRGYIAPNDETFWGRIPAEELNSFFVLSLINSVQQPDFAGSAGVYVNVSMSAAEDFTFGGMIHPFIRTPALDESPIVPHSLEEAHAKPYSALIPATHAGERGAVLPESFTTIEQMCMHLGVSQPFSQISALFPSVTDFLLPVGTGDAVPYYDNLEFYRRIFRWHRGSVRFKVQLPAGDETVSPINRYTSLALMPLEDQANFVLPAHFACSDMNLRGLVEAELPWIYPVPIASNWVYACDIDVPSITPLYQLPLAQGITNGPFDATVFRSAGDDFCFGHLLPPPFLNYTYTPGEKRKTPPRWLLSSEAKKKVPSAPSSSPTLDQSVGTPLTKAQILERLYSSIKK